MPGGSVADWITSAGYTVKLTARLAEDCPAEATTVNPTVPAAVGVPDNRPFEEIDSHDGAPRNDQEMPVAPVAEN